MTPAEQQIRAALAEKERAVLVGKVALAELLAELDRLRAERKPLTLDQIQELPEEIGMRVSHDRRTIRSVGQSGGMTLEDGIALIRAVERAHGITGD